MLSLASGGSKYLVSAANTGYVVSRISAQWMVACWVKWTSNTGASSKYAWSENGSGGAYVGLRFNNGGVTLGTYLGVNHVLHTPTLNTWYLYVIERNGDQLNAWVNNSQVLTAVTLANNFAWTTDVLEFGALVGAGGINLVGAAADIACAGAWSDKATSSGERASLYNSGTPHVGRMMEIASPLYIFEFANNRPIVGPMASLTEQGGAPTYTSNADLWGSAVSKATSAVTSIPGCVAFWPFQDGVDAEPVDVINGYRLQPVVTGQLPKVVKGGLFGSDALYFNNANGIYATKDGDLPTYPAIDELDINGASAQMTIVSWVRDYANDNNCRTIAGLWNEHAKRQYAQFRAVGDYNQRRVVTHICSLANNGGGSTNHGNIPTDIYNHEWAMSGQDPWAIDSAVIFAASTYDGLKARCFYNGVFDEITNSYGQRNPFTSGDGGGLSGGPSKTGEFAIGSRRLGEAENWGENWRGVIMGVAVFNRALTAREIATLAGVTQPTITIDTDDEQVITQGTDFDLDATGVSAGYSGAAVAWSSDIDGALGTGASLTVSDLTPGLHTITASYTATDVGVLDRATLTVEVLAVSSSSSSSSPAEVSSSSSSSPAEASSSSAAEESSEESSSSSAPVVPPRGTRRYAPAKTATQMLGADALFPPNMTGVGREIIPALIDPAGPPPYPTIIPRD